MGVYHVGSGQWTRGRDEREILGTDMTSIFILF